MTAASFVLMGTLWALQLPVEQGAEAPALNVNDADSSELAGRFGVIEGEALPQAYPRPTPRALPALPPPEESYEWQAAFLPATWPIWSLTLVGIGAIAAGFWTLAQVRRQIRVVTGPRLHLEGIRFTGLVAGARPVFFVRVGNAGATDAYGVRVSISALCQGGGGKTGAPQTMTIPAHSSRECFLRWQNALTTAVREDILGGSSKLCVKVAVEYGEGEPGRHCYQFHPWDGDRPPGVPDFVPCDLDSQLAGFTTGRTSRLAVTDDVPLIQRRRAAPQVPETQVKEKVPQLVLD